MPFKFSEYDYKNKFQAEIIQSDIVPSRTNPSQEVWNLNLLKLRKNENGEWDAIPDHKSCPYEGCNLADVHQHTQFYESDRPNSPAHKFLVGLREHGKMVITGARDLLGKRFTFEEEVKEPWTNPTTGVTGKARHYFYIAGPLEDAEEEEEAVSLTELPFGTTPLTPTMPAATTNGATASNEVPLDDLMATFLALIDGKTEEQVREAVGQTPNLKNSGAFKVKWITGKAYEELIGKGLAYKDAEGVYHIAA